ncbi:hypothetical protein ACSBR2_037478 [Camellia fascicularis]
MRCTSRACLPLFSNPNFESETHLRPKSRPHGHEAKALELFEQMKELGLKPDSVTFIALLTACNRAGLVDEGQAYFNSMNEIIDLLGRAGRLKEAVKYIEKFPFGHDPVVLVSLLSAC